jgi:hypothetical protein
LQEASSTFDVQETVRRKELQQEAVALALQLSEKYTPLEQKKPAHYPRQLHPLRWAFAGLGSILLLNTAYSLVASNDVFGSEINTEVDSSYSGNNPGKNPNNNFDDKKRVSSHSESPASSKKLVTSQLPRAGSFHYVTPHSTAQPTDEQTEDSNAVEQNSEQVSREYTVKSGDSLISIATKEYCSNLTGKKKGHCGVDTGMALGQWNHKIGRNGGISLHPKDQLNLPSEATLRSYVRSHERGLHHQFEKVRQYYGRR